ncbi:MAG: hypothetical protein ACJA2G_001268 [Cognaticolwellia sp.]
MLKPLLLNPLRLKILYIELVVDKLIMGRLSAIKATALEPQRLLAMGLDLKTVGEYKMSQRKDTD